MEKVIVEGSIFDFYQQSAWYLKVKSHEQTILFLFSLRCFQLLYWDWMQKLKRLYLLLLSAFHLYLYLFLSLYLQCQDKSLYLVDRHAEAAHRPLGCFQLRRTLCGKHSGTSSKQQAVLASKKQAQVLVYKQPAPPPLESAATSEIPPILLWL